MPAGKHYTVMRARPFWRRRVALCARGGTCTLEKPVRACAFRFLGWYVRFMHAL